MPRTVDRVMVENIGCMIMVVMIVGIIGWTVVSLWGCS